MSDLLCHPRARASRRPAPTQVAKMPPCDGATSSQHGQADVGGPGGVVEDRLASRALIGGGGGGDLAAVVGVAVEAREVGRGDVQAQSVAGGEDGGGLAKLDPKVVDLA